MAFSTRTLYRFIGLHREICQYRHKTKSGSEFWIDKKIIAADPTQAGQQSYLLMRNMGCLFFPIDDLGSRNWERIGAELLKIRGQKKSSPVEEKIELPIVMKIERSRLILDIFQDGVRYSLSKCNSPGKFRF